MTRATVEHADWGVWVNECVAFASGQGAEWWTAYLMHQPKERMTCLGMSIGGGLWHVACDSKEHAEWLHGHMVTVGIPATALKVKRLAQCKRVAAA